MAYIDMDQLNDAADGVTSPVMLPRARKKMSAGDTLSTNTDANPALPLTLRAQLSKVTKDLGALDSAEPDLSEWQNYARQRSDEGQGSMLNALAAQFAGPQFEGLQAQFLKKAAAAQEPMKLGNALMTANGQIIKDPYAARDQRRTALERQEQSLLSLLQKSEQATAENERKAAQDKLMSEIRLIQAQTGQENAATRRMMMGLTAQNQQNNAADKRNRQIETDTQGLSKRLEDIVPLAAGVNQLNATLAPYFKDGEKNIPGVGYGSNVNLLGMDVSGPFIGEEGKKIRSQVQNIANAIIRAEAGQAVSLNEAERQVLANMIGGRFSQRDFMNAYENVILPKVNEAIANVGGGYNPEVKAQYERQGGRVSLNKPYESPRKAASFADPDKERRYQEWKRQQGGQ